VAHFLWPTVYIHSINDATLHQHWYKWMNMDPCNQQFFTNVADSEIQMSDSVNVLGATFDSTLNMGPHTKSLSKPCFYHIHSFSFGQICSSMDHSMAVSVVLALIPLCLDYVIQSYFNIWHSTAAHIPPSASPVCTHQRCNATAQPIVLFTSFLHLCT